MSLASVALRPVVAGPGVGQRRVVSRKCGGGARGGATLTPAASSPGGRVVVVARCAVSARPHGAASASTGAGRAVKCAASSSGEVGFGDLDGLLRSGGKKAEPAPPSEAELLAAAAADAERERQAKSWIEAWKVKNPDAPAAEAATAAAAAAVEAAKDAKKAAAAAKKEAAEKKEKESGGGGLFGFGQQQVASTGLSAEFLVLSTVLTNAYFDAAAYAYEGGAVQVDPGLSQLPPRLVSTLESKI